MWVKVLKQVDRHSIVQVVGKPSILKAMVPGLPPPGYVHELHDAHFDFLTSQLVVKTVSCDCVEPLPKRPKLES